MRVAIAGFGDLGRRLARRLVARGDAVLALRRSEVATEPGVSLQRCDVTRLRTGELADWRADALVVALAPEARTPAAYRQTYVDALAPLAAALGDSLQRCVQVGSTAVYGGDDGGWADEDTPAAPSAWNGDLLLEAERRAGECLPGLIRARCSGLYGPGRTWLWRRALAGESGDARWTNRIHVEDAAEALAHLLRCAQPASCYCVTDDTPALEHEVLNGLRALQGLPPSLPAELVPRGRRISNARLRASGWRPRYPGWREGYAAELLRSPQSDAAPT